MPLGALEVAPAAVLSRHDHVQVRLEGGEASWTFTRTEVVRVNTGAGIAAAEVRIPLLGSDSIEFSGRTRLPDGSIRLLDPATARTVRVGRAGGTSHAVERIYRFPAVRVGSSVEYAWSRTAQGLPTELARDVVDQLPIRRYRLTIEGPASLRFACTGHRLGTEFTKTEDGEAWRVELALSGG